MRLIDADALKKEVEFQQEHMWPEDLSYCIPKMIDEQPTIDAIPVEWLQESRRNSMDAQWHYAVATVLSRWQQEQEGR